MAGDQTGSRSGSADTTGLQELAEFLRERIAPRLQTVSRTAQHSASLQIHPHLQDGLETAEGPALSVRLIGGHTAAGGDIGTDVFVISNPHPDQYEVRRLSSGKLVNSEIGWPLRGRPSSAHVDSLLDVMTGEFFKTQKALS